MTPIEKEELDRVRESLRRLLNRVPNHSNWSSLRTIDFKKAFKKAQAITVKRDTTAVEVTSHYNTMLGYYA